MSNSTPEWKALETHHSALNQTRIDALFGEDAARFDGFHLELDGLLFDYSKNLVATETIEHLIALAKTTNVESGRDKMFSGAPINITENRSVLHAALRGSIENDLEVDGENITQFVSETLEQIKKTSETIRSENKFTDVVNIGIGGSDLGPHMAHDALTPYADGPKVHFVSNIDGAHISQTLKNLNPETTLFVIASKTFTTLETMSNAEEAKAWINRSTEEHFLAVTANTEAAASFGISEENILPLRDWIGGRYSVWSAIGLPVALSIGFENFKAFLDGAHKADEHFKSADLKNNIPVIMALLSIWHRNICDYDAQAILPYAQNLERFPRYIQQLEMESNGKSVSSDGDTLNYNTSPVIFGEPGTNSQHAFFQLLHQGTEIIPCDFIVAAKAKHDLKDHQTKLVANALAQSEALMKGKANTAKPHQNFEGNRPSSTFVLPELSPYYLGMLMALYEHKVFVQGLIWNINSFDQWGVELGKELAKNLIDKLSGDNDTTSHDSSTEGLLKHISKFS